MQLPLYTGQIGFITEKKKIDLIKIFLWNLIGIGIIILIKMFTDPIFVNALTEKAILKFNKTILRMFVDGFICGTLIHLAVKCKKPLLTSMAVVIFILTGSEHCIADFPYLLFNLSPVNILKFIGIVLGNSIGAILIERLS